MFGHFLAVQGIRQLQQNASSVAHESVGPNGAPVVQVLQDFERLRHDGVRFGAFDVGHKAHATGVVFVFGVVQTKSGGHVTLHGSDSPIQWGDEKAKASGLDPNHDAL